jgi:hypothetical protein
VNIEASGPWQGLPYFPISQFYRREFGEKVQKISVSFASTCPNREGLKGMQTCNFCDVWGSAAFPEKQSLSVMEQIAQVRELMRTNHRASKFLVYFQAYTSTFAKTAALRAQFEAAFSFADVVGAVVGTRPDCLSDAVLELWQETSLQKFMAVELGVQSFNNEQLHWMRRGHTREQSLAGIARIAKSSPGVDLGIHLMFGLPGETDDQLIETARLCNDSPITNVKLHNLHVLKNTPLETDYLEGRFSPIEKPEYFRRCELFLKHLSPRIAVHRLAALSNKPGELVAPEWTAFKMKTYQEFLTHMRSQGSTQGQELKEIWQ